MERIITSSGVVLPSLCVRVRRVVSGSGSLPTAQSLLPSSVHVGLGQHEQSRRRQDEAEPRAARDQRPPNSQLQRRVQVLVAGGDLRGFPSGCSGHCGRLLRHASSSTHTHGGPKVARSFPIAHAHCLASRLRVCRVCASAVVSEEEEILFVDFKLYIHHVMNGIVTACNTH